MILHQIRTRVLLVCLAACSVAATAQPVLSIPDTTGRKGDTLLIPVTLTGIGGNSLYAIQATVDLNNAHIQVVGVSTSGTLTAGASVSYFATTRRLAVALTTPVTSNGVLFHLQAVLIGTPGQQTSVGLSSVLVNEGTPSVTVDAGSVRLRKVTIAPSYLANVAEGDSVQFTATGDIVPPLTWSTSSASVGTIDAAGKFRAITPGFVYVAVTDGEGKRDSTNTFNVVPNTIKSLTLWIPDTSRTQTLEVAVPVRVTTVTGLGITSAQFRVTFNTSHLQYLGSTTVGGIAAGWGVPTVNDQTPGVLDIAMAGPDTLSGAGTILWARFRVKSSAVGSSTIGLANAVFNETIIPALDPGTFTVIPAPLIKVNTSAGFAYKGGTITVTSVTGGTSPFAYSSSSPTVASVDPTSGLLTVLSRGPVLIRAVDALGFPGASDTIWTYDFAAVTGDTVVNPGDSVSVPIDVGTTDGLGIVAYQFRVAYDTAVVSFRGADVAGTLSNGFTVVVKDSASILRVAAAGTTPLSGVGTLIKLRFRPNPPSIPNEQSLLTVSAFSFNEPGPATPMARPISGRIRVVFPNTPPTFTSELPDTSVAEGMTLNWTYTATDVDPQPLRFRVVTAPSGASLDSVSGAFTWSPGYSSAGAHPVVIVVTDGLAADTASAIITVTNVDRPPVFTLVLSDTSIIAGSVLNFTYAANDPDGDPVRYAVASGPAFASVDSMTGTLTFAPAPVNLGAFTVQVTAKSGGVVISTSATVTVTSSGTSVPDIGGAIPSEFALLPNYPNPFNPATAIRFALPLESRVTLKIYDHVGRTVATLADRDFSPGNHEMRWDAAGMASGLYFCRIEAVMVSGQRFHQSMKMMLLK